MATAAKEIPLTPVESGSSITFTLYEDNGGRNHWRLLAGDGHPLATSDASFASADDAQRSLSDVRDAVGSRAVG